MYEILKYVIPGAAVGTTLEQVDLKLKEARSDPRMKKLLCQYNYEKVLDVAAVLVNKGVFEVNQGSTLSYVAACRAAKIAKGDLTEDKDDLEQSPESGKENTSAFRSLRSSASEANASTTPEAKKSIETSDTATKQFDLLLQEHLKASKSPSTTSATSSSLERVKASEHVSSKQPAAEAEPVEATAKAADNQTERYRVPLKNEQGLYYEEYLDKVYQILKLDLKGLRYNNRGGFRQLVRKINKIADTNHELEEARQQHGVMDVFHISYWMARRGLFLVDYIRFPRFREAAREASEILPGYTIKYARTDNHASTEAAPMANARSTELRTLSLESSSSTETLEPSNSIETPVQSVMVTERDHSTGAFIPAPQESENATKASKQLPSPAPWEPIKIPSMHEVEPTTSRDAIPESWKMRFLVTQEGLEILDDIDLVHNEPVEFEDYTYVRLPSAQELELVSDQDGQLNVNGLRLLDYDSPEIHARKLVQDTPSEVPTPVPVQDLLPVSDPDVQHNVNGLRLLDSQPSDVPAPVPTQNLSGLVRSEKAEIVTDERYGKPSKVLIVSGIGMGINIKHLFKSFANVLPVDINFNPSKRVAVIEFTNIEAAKKALEAKHGTFLGGRALNCEFSSKSSLQDQVGIRKIVPKQPVDDHIDDSPLTSEPPNVKDMISVPKAIATNTVAQGPKEMMKKSVGEALATVAAEAVRHGRTQILADELLLSSEPEPPNQTTFSRRLPRRQRYLEPTKIAQPVTKEPASSIEARPDKPRTEDRAETTTVKSRSAESEDDLSKVDDAYREAVKGASTDQATANDLEADGDIYTDEPVLTFRAWRLLSQNAGLKKGPSDHIPPDIEQYATIPVPRTHAYYLPHPTQIKVLSGLQVSLEQVCFRYLERKHPELLKGTPTRWGIDSAHALELNKYMYLLGTLIVPTSKVFRESGGSKDLQALVRSMAGLRHNAVHRFRVDIGSLCFWASDAVKLAKLLNDHEAVRRFSSLVSSLMHQKRMIEAEKMKAEESLLAMVKELAAKRAELNRAEREAMTAFNAAHNKHFDHDFQRLDKIIDARIPLDHGFGVELEETSSAEESSAAKPTSGIFGRIKSWFGA